MTAVNPDIQMSIVNDRLSEENARKLLGDSDLCFDTVDNLESKMLLQDSCRELGIPFVHAAVGARAGFLELRSVVPDPGPEKHCKVCH